ncbi:MAG TPA: tyrosine--tRNA ligase, partial [Candidatus Ozemobacteraceae bacterium]|nr:tyrosine--tRNA ligase [Candidatus Ozemobacteraceae bacterium]
MKFQATPKEQLEIVATGTVDIVSRDELLKKFEKSYATGKPLVIKLGADPSAPDIHLGHTVVLQKMRQFQ